jgi:rhodanese-related sulfurtransferase
MKESVKRAVILFASLSGVLLTTYAISISQASSAELQHISAEELKKLIESKANILVVDVQPKEAYKVGHIKGAINLPWAKEIKGPINLPKNKELVIYCDCTHEEDSTDIFGQGMSNFDSCASKDDSIDVAEQLMNKFGYKNIRVLEGGWSMWQRLGYPTDEK